MPWVRTLASSLHNGGRHMARKIRLTKYQKKILGLLAAGKGRGGIAEELGITESTVRTRINDIKDEFRMQRGTNIEDLLAAARQAGVIE